MKNSILEMVSDFLFLVRYFGILQRISVCYLIVSLIHFLTRYGEQKYRFIGFLIALSIGMVYVVFMSTF